MEQIARDPRADFLAVYNRSIGRNGKAALLYWLENDTDFFTAPASSKNHLAQPGGLAVHSLNVWRRLREITVRDMTDRNAPGVRQLSEAEEETVAILGLLHDVCKVGVYHQTDPFKAAMEGKSGKWKDTEKGTTSVEGSFEEFGECPIEHHGKGKEADRILELLKDGANNLEVIEEVPGAMKFIDKVERTRSTLRDAQFANSWRDLTVTYLFGRTGSGKTRSVMDRYGYANCYRVTDYRHPFDTYDGQDVLIFEEFRGGLKHGDMLNYLDGYPLLLPCRYFNRQRSMMDFSLAESFPEPTSCSQRDSRNSDFSTTGFSPSP